MHALALGFGHPMSIGRSRRSRDASTASWSSLGSPRSGSAREGCSIAPHAGAVHEAEVLRLLDVADARRSADRVTGRRGAAKLLAVVGDPRGRGPTRSELEERFLRLCSASALPMPRTNAHIDAGDRLIEVDALWPDHGLIVELDGEHVHRTRRAFHDDRRRDAALAARGYVVLRLTWQRVTTEPTAVAAELRRVLALRAARRAPRP